jgi:DNA-binding CsgD family transcriptional regulator
MLIQPTARESARVFQPDYGYDPEDRGVPLTRQARSRGVETELVTRPATVATHPLLSSIFPHTLLGPCFLRALVVDGRQAIVGGADDADGRRVSWITDIPDLVDAVNDLWDATLPLCTPILAEGESPPLNERQLEVARLICLGEKDDAIARTLSVSVRTVEREVATVLSVLDARSRAEAVLAMRGRGVNGGQRTKRDTTSETP